MCFRDDAERGLESRYLTAIADRIDAGDLTAEAAKKALRPSKMHPDRIWWGSETAPCEYLAELQAVAQDLPRGTTTLRRIVERIRTAAI